MAEAWRAGDRLGVEVVPGVEISVDPPWGDRELHLLGYYVKENEELESKLRWARGARERRNLRIIEKLVGLGMDISYEEVKRLAGGDVVGRPHIARLLVEKGYVKSFEEAFLILLHSIHHFQPSPFCLFPLPHPYLCSFFLL